jgi:hypothetical protein
MWVEQAGKGVAEVEALIRIDPERTPAEIHFAVVRIPNATQRGHARDHICEASSFPLPPSQLVLSTWVAHTIQLP